MCGGGWFGADIEASLETLRFSEIESLRACRDLREVLKPRRALSQIPLEPPRNRLLVFERSRSAWRRTSCSASWSARSGSSRARVFSQAGSSVLDRSAEAAMFPALPVSTYEKQSRTGKRLY